MNYNTKLLEKDHTPTGVEVVGSYENDRNAVYASLYEDIINEVYDVTQHKVICGHHLVYQTQENLIDPVTGPYVHTFTQEIPSADWLVFDHKVARKIWGPEFKTVLARLACEPVETRDALLSELYYGRTRDAKLH